MVLNEGSLEYVVLSRVENVEDRLGVRNPALQGHNRRMAVKRKYLGISEEALGGNSFEGPFVTLFLRGLNPKESLVFSDRKSVV